MLYGLETVALTKRQEADMEVAELTMLRSMLRVTIMDKIRNDYIRRTAQVGWVCERKHERQFWGGRDMYGGNMVSILREWCWGWNCNKRRNGEGLKGGLWMNWESMAVVEVTERMQKIWPNRGGKIRSGDPWPAKPKEEEGSKFLCSQQWRVQ